MINTVRIIGIDPGSRYTGFGIIEKRTNNLRHIHSGVITTIKEKTVVAKLKKIFQELTLIIQKYQPVVSSIEKIFHSVNPQSTLLLGQARGVALLALAQQNLTVYEYAPNEVKSAVVGMGKADKNQVQYMVKILLNYRQPMPLDESDALAIAICHANNFLIKINPENKY